MRRLWITLGVLTVMICPPAAHAQSENKISIARLQSLYQQEIKAPADSYIQKLIADERIRIRKQIENELKGSLAPSLDPTREGNAEELTKAMDNQRNTVTALTQNLSGQKADLDLLAAEEERFYKHPQASDSTQTFRLTQSYPELLAKRALLEERIGVLQSLLDLQQNRLNQLINQQRLEQFGTVIGLGKYALAMFIVLLIEREIRRRFLSRIRDNDRRYRLTKSFTASVYFVMILWLIGLVYAKNPNIVASLAIVGAGLAIALQDVVKDMVGWLMIIQNSLFSRGHRITVGTITGEVTDYGLLRTTMLEVGMPHPGEAQQVLERTGKILSIPNATFLTQPLTNHSTTSEYVRAEMRLTVTYESDWRKAQAICKRILDEETGAYVEADQRQTRKRTHQYFIPHRTSGNQVYFDLVGDGVELTLRFTVPIGDRRPVVSAISDAILSAFIAEHINLAYRTSRVVELPQRGNGKGAVS